MIWIAAVFPGVARRIRDARSEIYPAKQVPTMAALIIVGTALPEEILFRGVLLGGWKAAGYSVPTAVVMSSLPFGLWHIASELEWFRENPRARPGAAKSGVLGAVAFTTLAGIAFASLREATGSIWTGVVLHAAANISAMFAGRHARSVLIKGARARESDDSTDIRHRRHDAERLTRGRNRLLAAVLDNLGRLPLELWGVGS